MTRKNNTPQAKKPKSGAAKRRIRQPTEPVSTSYLFRKVANEEVEIEVEGRKMVVTRWEALLRQIHTMALNNNFKAARLLHQVRQRFPGRAASGGTYFLICSDADLEC